MIKNQKQYRAVWKQHEALNETILEYKIRVARENKAKVLDSKDDQRHKVQLDIFKGQLSDVTQELEAYEHRMEFREYAKEGNDDKVFEMSFENPLLKKYLNRDQLIRLSDYYENGINKVILGLGQLANSNKFVKDLVAKLDGTSYFLEKGDKK